jgi:asparagine synthase (glutamine-hydrolysing)
MRRLSIIDLSGGHQPIFSEDGTKAVVLNGEIYNYRDLRQELISRGHRLRSQSDTETIVHLYEDYGPDCVTRLRGMFAFALWDASARTLMLARDRFGIKPLYVAASSRQLAFASELKALWAAGLDVGRLDWRALDAFFRLGYVPAPYTPFTGVRKLEPGHVLVWKETGAWTDRAYWDLPVGEQPAPANVPDVVRQWLDESVAAHLVSDVPLAVLLSGGLDSSAVLASMALAGARPHAYTARYHGSGATAADETELAAALAERYGARLTIVDVEPHVADLIEPIARALDEPHADESAIPTWLISERVSADYKVALAGTGGDELFAGYRRHLGLLLSERYTRLPASLRAAAAAVVGMLPEPRGGQLGLHRLKRFLKTAPGAAPARYFDMLNKLPDANGRSLFSSDIVKEIRGSPAAERLAKAYHAGGSPRGLKAALYLDYKTYLPDDILHVSDRISMAHSLEVRVPFVDHVLVEHAFPLPDATKIGRGNSKHLLRRALEPRLPVAHLRAPKRGFVGPTAMWLRNELRELALDELSPARIGRLGFFDPTVVNGFLKDHMTHRHNRESVLWALLEFSVWHRVYCETMPAPTAAPA